MLREVTAVILSRSKFYGALFITIQILWCIIHHDPNFDDFRWPKFTSFSVEGSGGINFGKSIIGAFEYHTCNSFSCLVLFLEN